MQFVVGGGTGTFSLTKMAEEVESAMAPVQANWEQNDETADDYIKNRPFYATKEKKKVTLVEGTFTSSYNAWYKDSNSFRSIFQESGPLTIVFNGIEYTTGEEEKIDGGNAFFVNDKVYFNYVYAEGGITFCHPDIVKKEPFSLKVSRESEVETVISLDEKYLPGAKIQEPTSNDYALLTGKVLSSYNLIIYSWNTTLFNKLDKLPLPTIDDEGKVLVVNSFGSYDLKSISELLESS